MINLLGPSLSVGTLWDTHTHTQSRWNLTFLTSELSNRQTPVLPQNTSSVCSCLHSVLVVWCSFIPRYISLATCELIPRVCLRQCARAMACTSPCGRSSATPCSSSRWCSRVSTRRPPPRRRWCSGGTSPTAGTALGSPSACRRVWPCRRPSWAPRPTWSAPTPAAPCESWPRRREPPWRWRSTTKAGTSPSLTVMLL